MCIARSVGRGGVNRRDDGKTVQILLNLNLGKLIPLAELDEDGAIGDKTVFAIEEFQRRVVEMPVADGRVDPNGATLMKLKEGMPPGFLDAKLRGIMIHATRANISRYALALRTSMQVNQVNTWLRMTHFLAQIAHESDDLRYSEEIASGEDYEGRADLGNTQPGDGKRFKGRGLIQLTGRSNYEKYGTARGKDYTTDGGAKLLSTDAPVAVDVSLWFWTEHNLNALADQDNLAAITRAINGGYNGLEDRRARLERAKCFLVR